MPLHGLQPSRRGLLEVQHGEARLHRRVHNVDLEINFTLITPPTGVRSIEFGKLHLRKRRIVMARIIIQSISLDWRNVGNPNQPGSRYQM